MIAHRICAPFKPFCLALLSSSFLVLSFPTYPFSILAWVGLVPLLVAINGKSLTYGFFLSFICGIFFFLGIFSWILVIPNYTLLHHSLLAIYLGSYFGFFGLAVKLISKYLGDLPSLFAAPFLWVSFEYVRSNLSFLSLPWALLAHSQDKHLMVIQIASLAGTYSISFLIVLANAALASLILRQPKTPLPSRRKRQKPINKGRLAFVMTSASLTFLVLLYGHFNLSQAITGDRMKVSLVQGNIEQVKKWDPRYAHEIMTTYSELTHEASKERPLLVIWPETATPGSISSNQRLHAEVRNIAIRAGTHLLLGSAQHQKFEPKDAAVIEYLNSAYLINSDPGMTQNQRYDKIRLFPFGEYLPYREIIPWSLIHVRESSQYMLGKEFTLFGLPPFRFGVTICWENVFPDLFRQFVKRGAEFMINITNEARFGKTAAPYQLASISVFRAIENKIFVIRCANTGISCIIDPYGRMIDRIRDKNGEDIFVQGILTGSIIPLKSKTLYTRYGDWFVWISSLGSAVFFSIAFLKGLKTSHDI
jgi:apolipoprotein N-acyltransferase